MGTRARVVDQAEVAERGKPLWTRECREKYVPDEIAVLLGWTKMAATAVAYLTDAAENRYRPSAALDRAVRARDVTCRFPGCRRTADSAGTDPDHTEPWHYTDPDPPPDG